MEGMNVDLIKILHIYVYMHLSNEMLFEIIFESQTTGHTMYLDVLS